jgi:raffinose/stachyose/melibiose transport system substrate-binding protein
MRKQALLSCAVFAAAACLAPLAQAADVTVRLLHIDQSPAINAFYNDVARRFEGTHPGVKVEIQSLENESFKRKVTTLLQSPDRPNILYSWGGGVLREQVKAGVLEDLSAPMNAQWKDRFLPAAAKAYDVDGKMYGVPLRMSLVGFFYNKDLFAKAGVDGAAIRTWDDLLGAVKKLRDAGITPVVVGGADKWPLSLYWSHLAMRVGGKPALDAAKRGEGKGFASDTFVRSGELFKQLVDLKPFQPGFMGANNAQASGQFGDGKGAMILTLNVVLNVMKDNAADKQGLPDEKIGWLPFPTVAGGKGDPNDAMGNLNGWIVTKGSPKETVDFLRFFSDAENQKLAAERGLYIPPVTESLKAIHRPILRQTLQNVAQAKVVQVNLDQELGPLAGAVVNDMAASIAVGKTSPAEAAGAIQQAWRRAATN